MVWTLAAVAVAAFAAGFAVGFYTAGTLERANTADMRLYISVLIATVWALSVASGIVVDDYQPSLALHAIMGAAAGYFFKTGNPIASMVSGATGGNTGGEEDDDG